FLAGTTGFATTARAVVAENADRIIEVNRVGRPTLSLLARYSPEYPCLLAALKQSNDFIGKTFANGELHITLEVVRSRDPYRPGEEPAWGEHRGPHCYGIPDHPPVPAPALRLDDGSGGPTGGSGRAVPGFLLDPTSGYAGSGEEQAVVRSLVAPAMGRQADDVPDLATLLFGPMARGTAVSAH
ncbi:MAG TPA: MCE family protein, partial [Actinomycetes bacterium]